MAGAPSSLAKGSKTSAQEKIKSPLCKDNTDVAEHTLVGSSLATGIPIIDVDRFVSVVTDTKIYEIRPALRSWGCFQVLNHGIERSFTRWSAANWPRLLSSTGDRDAKIRFERRWERRLHSTTVLVVDNQFPNNLGLRIVPEDRQKPQSFNGELKRVEEGILKLISKALRLSDEKILTRKTGVMYAQLNYYPPSPSPAQTVLSLREHADASVITLLLQDDDQMGETQVHKDGTWYSIPIMANALFVFVGDQLEIMSNGIFKSRVHRAVRLNTGQIAGCVLLAHGWRRGWADRRISCRWKAKNVQESDNYMGFYYPYFCKGSRALDALRI